MSLINHVNIILNNYDCVNNNNLYKYFFFFFFNIYIYILYKNSDVNLIPFKIIM